MGKECIGIGQGGNGLLNVALSVFCQAFMARNMTGTGGTEWALCSCCGIGVGICVGGAESHLEGYNSLWMNEGGQDGEKVVFITVSIVVVVVMCLGSWVNQDWKR